MNGFPGRLKGNRKLTLLVDRPPHNAAATNNAGRRDTLALVPEA